MTEGVNAGPPALKDIGKTKVARFTGAPFCFCVLSLRLETVSLKASRAGTP
jgi:hypothetical protein